MPPVNVQQKDLHGQQSISQEHVDNNKAVRNMMLQRGIVPEKIWWGCCPLPFRYALVAVGLGWVG